MEETVYHVVKLVGGVLDGSTIDILTENIPFVNCVVNSKTKTAHYYHLTLENVVGEQSNMEYLKTYYRFWVSEELTEDDEKYLEDRSGDQYKGIRKHLNKADNDNNSSK